jgi:hypothetical protein
MLVLFRHDGVSLKMVIFAHVRNDPANKKTRFAVVNGKAGAVGHQAFND